MNVALFNLINVDSSSFHGVVDSSGRMGLSNGTVEWNGFVEWDEPARAALVRRRDRFDTLISIKL